MSSGCGGDLPGACGTQMSITVHPEAAAELKAAAVFYSQRANVEVGLGLLDEFERTVAVIGESPELGVIWRGAARRLPMRRFPFFIYYRLVADSIEILAVAHQRRRPGYWRERQKKSE